MVVVFSQIYAVKDVLPQNLKWVVCARAADFDPMTRTCLLEAPCVENDKYLPVCEYWEARIRILY